MPIFESSRKVQVFGSSLAVTLPAFFVKANEIEKGSIGKVYYGLEGILVVSLVDDLKAREGLMEIIEHDKTGVVVYPNNPGSLTWGILRLLTDETYAKRISRNAFLEVVDRYNWRNIAEKTKKVYQQVLR